MQTKLSDGSSSSDMLKKPTHILTFIKHALESAKADSHGSNTRPINRSPRDRCRDDQEDDIDSDEDSDDDTPDAIPYTADDEMTETSINLLLSILEGARPYLVKRFFFIHSL